MNNIPLSDSDFIEGSISENYPVPSLSEEEYFKLPADMRNDAQEHLIQITRNDTGESRKFHVNKYAELLLEGFLQSVDNHPLYNHKLLILANAKLKLNHLSDFLRPFDKYKFKREFKKIDDTIAYLKAHKKLGTFDEIPPTISQPSNGTQTNTENPDSNQSPIETPFPTNELNKYTIAEIALLYVYNQETIRGYEHGSEIAQKYRSTSETTGKQLYDEYTKFNNRTNRLNTNGNKRTTTNMLRRIENILPLISNAHGQNMAKDEMNILQSKQERN